MDFQKIPPLFHFDISKFSLNSTYIFWLKKKSLKGGIKTPWTKLLGSYLIQAFYEITLSEKNS